MKFTKSFTPYAIMTRPQMMFIQRNIVSFIFDLKRATTVGITIHQVMEARHTPMMKTAPSDAFMETLKAPSIMLPSIQA